MYTQPNKVHQKLISFPDPIYIRLNKRVKKVGLSFSEYIRFVLLDHLGRPEPLGEVEELDTETARRVLLAEKELKKGKGVILKTEKDIDDYFRKII